MKPGQPTTYDEITGADTAAMWDPLCGMLSIDGACVIPSFAHFRRALAKMHADEQAGSDPIIFARAGTDSVILLTIEMF